MAERNQDGEKGCIQKGSVPPDRLNKIYLCPAAPTPNPSHTRQRVWYSVDSGNSQRLQIAVWWGVFFLYVLQPLFLYYHQWPQRDSLIFTSLFSTSDSSSWKRRFALILSPWITVFCRYKRYVAAKAMISSECRELSASLSYQHSLSQNSL